MLRTFPFLAALTVSLSLLPACGDDDEPTTPTACDGKGGDTDADDICQAEDNCPAAANPEQADRDADGVGDACDPTTNGRCDELGGDSDADTVCDLDDNCPEVVNAGQEDYDHDGAGDACDDPTLCSTAGGDPDGDQVCQAMDNCPDEANPEQKDSDEDGEGDACDATPGPCDDLGGDTDTDSVCNLADNCPGVPNAGQADADADGVGDACEGLAACSEAGGDEDGDHVCGAFDNCSLTANADQFDADHDGIGNVCDTEVCDGEDNNGDGDIDENFPDADGDGHADCLDDCAMPAPLLPAGATLPANLSVSDLVANPGEDTLYLAVSGGNPTYGNSIVAIDAPSGSVLWALPVGSMPGPMAISDDGTTIHVALQGSGEVRQIDVPTRRACLIYTMPADPFFGQYQAGDLEVLPGTTETVVISMRRPSVSPDFAGVYVFDQGVARPTHTTDHTGARMITAASATVLYGYNNSTTEFGMRRLEVSADGVREVWVVENLVGGFATDIVFAGNRLYATNGFVVNPDVPALAGQFDAVGPILVAPEAGEAYVATQDGEIEVFSTNTFVSLGSIPLPGAPAVTKLVRWGGDGLAVLTGDGIRILPDAIGL